MAIPAASCFDYEAPLTRSRSGGWTGLAVPTANQSVHPGLAGDQPTLELAGGTVTLRRTESVLGRFKSHHQSWGTSPSQVSFRVGEALEAVVEDGDLLCVSRGGTTDLSATLCRSNYLVMGLGAVAHRRLGPGVTIQEDPRANDVDLYHLTTTLDRPDTTLVWLDSSDPHVDEALSELSRPPGTGLVIAIAGPDSEERRQLNWRAAALASGAHTSCEFVDVDSRFTTRETWLDYLRQLPKTRPRDLSIRFGFDGQDIDVREGEYAFREPWHLFVAKVYTPGIPGEWSQLAVARKHRVLTAQMVVDSTELIASGQLQILR